MSAINPLTHTELLERAPALFTEEPHFEVSDKYHFIPTIDVIYIHIITRLPIPLANK